VRTRKLTVLFVVALSVLAAACDLASAGAAARPPATGPTGDPASEPDASEPVPEEAAADPFQLPFGCGQQWRLDTWGHAPALDMVREPDQTGTEGAEVVAPAAGVVNQSFVHDNAGNVIQIDHGDGMFTTYLHLGSRAVEAGDDVVQRQRVGTVGRTGPSSNNHPHLHFELAVDANGDGRATWGSDGSERIRPVFDGVEYGQADGQTWRNVASNNGCVTPGGGRS
jgi:murein DD-endopeptidase MepM/ murein hydrolase activator NlpD